MGESARPRWRDALMLTVVAVAMVVGLVHYGTGLSDDPSANPSAPVGSTTSVGGTPTGSPEPSAPATTSQDAEPTVPAEPTEPGRATCWDGTRTDQLEQCTLPRGARGLSWVFPSFSPYGCHRTSDTTEYAVVLSYECFNTVRGNAVTITYDHVSDLPAVEEWFEGSYGVGHRIELPGADGGRYVFKDAAGNPARISGLYGSYPYVVSVFAPDKQTMQLAWDKLVLQRPAKHVRGLPAPIA